MTPSPAPQWYRILQIDSIAFITALFPLVFWGFYFGLPLFGDPAPITAFWVDVAVTVIALVALGARLALIYCIFAHGEDTSGTVQSVTFFRDRGWVEVAYVFRGESLRSRSALMKTRRTAALKEGAPVQLLVDTEHPQRALIRDLYL